MAIPRSRRKQPFAHAAPSDPGLKANRAMLKQRFGGQPQALPLPRRYLIAVFYRVCCRAGRKSREMPEQIRRGVEVLALTLGRLARDRR